MLLCHVGIYSSAWKLRIIQFFFSLYDGRILALTRWIAIKTKFGEQTPVYHTLKYIFPDWLEFLSFVSTPIRLLRVSNLIHYLNSRQLVSTFRPINFATLVSACQRLKKINQSGFTGRLVICGRWCMVARVIGKHADHWTVLQFFWVY